MAINFKHSHFLLLILAIGLFLLCNGCKNKEVAKKKQKYEVSNSIDSLKSYIKLSGLKSIYWIIRPLGIQSSFSIGPQDYELILFSPSIPPLTKKYIENNLTINEGESEKVYIDSSIAKSLGIDIHSLQTDSIYIIKGKVYDAKPLLTNMTSGIVVITDFGLLLIAETS